MSTDDDLADHFVTVAEVAAMCGVSDITVRRWMRRGALRFPRPAFPAVAARLLLFDRAEVEAWRRAREEGQ